MIDYNDMKDKIEEIGYYATEELLYDTYNALYMIDEEEKQTGQDIYAICLEGPPGAGKTAFAKTYTEICKKMVDDKTEMISYQCDATTGKSELFEDINVSAAITRDGSKVNIPGKLVEAIKKANEGHRVILFIDEYDKAREETDAFFLQLLQDGKINSTQHGDLEVKDEFKSHLQVIFCKNDMREEVSGPLSRRLRIIRLDLMRPELFFKLANRLLIEEKENKVNDGLLNLVTLMYEEAYNNREIYKRLPACSEMLIALEDADRLLKRANAPKHVIYNSIIKNMFKSLDDIKTFESEVENNNTELYNLINSMKSSKNDEDINKESINSLIARNIYKDTFNKLNAKMDELDKVTREYKERFSHFKHIFTGVNMYEVYRDLVLKEGCEFEMIFSNKPEDILRYTNDVIACDIHTRNETKARIEKDGVDAKVLTLSDILNESVDGSGYSPYGLLGSNRSTEERVKLFPRTGNVLVNKVQKLIKEKTGKTVEVMVYGDGAFKDPVGKIWELADPVVSPAYTSGLEGSPNEIKLKYFSENKFKDLKGEELKQAMIEEIRTKDSKLKGSMATQGTTPRRYTDLLGSLCDLTSGSGDKGTPVVLIQRYFTNYSNE